jgi:quinohemoprotein amine dehydrogenase
MKSFARLLVASCLLWCGLATTSILGQQPTAPPPNPSTAPQAKPEEGIPITSPVVQKACAPCHALDDKQQMSRISFQRNTPEGWQENIRRMAALNGLKIDSATAREVVKYLSDHLGLAPEEAKPAAFDVERRVIDYSYKANADAESTCNKCHSLGRVISQRRTRDEWNLLVAMHRGWYPLVDNQAFRRGGPAPRDPAPDGRPPDTRQPVEKAIDHLSKAFPLKTPEWAAWSATMRPARLDGTWAIRGAEIGKGEIYGQVTIKATSPASDEFTTTMTIVDARTGARVQRTGQANVYTGFQWRGRSSLAGGGDDSGLREVMFVDRDWRTIEGRWFTGAYDELGMDITLERVAGAESRVLGTSKTALRVGGSGQELSIYGANLPTTLAPGDIDLGPGVTVARVVKAGADEVVVSLDVAEGAAPGARDLFVAGASRPKAVAVYKNVDAIKVTPGWAMARVGGTVFPKGLAQFEARAFDNGPDGKPDTADDIDLGVINASWTLEEYTATYDDDDVKFVGTIDGKTGRFTPNMDGPNPSRRGNRNNVGDVYAVATYAPEAADGKAAKPLRARAHLLVTVPLYMRWEPTERAAK